MNSVAEQPVAVDRAKLAQALAALASEDGSIRADDARPLAILKAVLDDGRASIRQRFETGEANGTMTARATSVLLDAIVGELFAFASARAYPLGRPTTGDKLAVVATGGFGRGELAPYSDLDLMFLFPYKLTPRSEQLVEYGLYRLWDLGLKVGPATRSVDEAIRLAKDDITVRTSLLETRFVVGELDLYTRFRDRFVADVVTGSGPDFVRAKLAERDRRHASLGDTRYLLEPNIKEGKGGLRDLQTLFWIAKYLYRVGDASSLVDLGVFTRADARRFAKAENFLWAVRIFLHYLAERPEERLTFDSQIGLAPRLGYTDHAGTKGVQRFMKHYYLVAKDVGDLTRNLCAVLEACHVAEPMQAEQATAVRPEPPFRLEGGRLAVETNDAFSDDPVRLIRLYHEADRLGVAIHPRTIRLVIQNLDRVDGELRANPDANQFFVDLLTSSRSPDTALKRMNESGVLGRFIPPFGRVVAQMQYDMFHVYTVDEHTIRAIGHLSQIEKGLLKDELPVSTAAAREVRSRRALYLALLLHDVAKGRGGEHSSLGAEIGERMARRLGLDDWEADTVSWLVRHHLVMTATAFKRDIDDPKTIADFVALVQSPERLRLLLLLTVADVRAVGPGIWNNWKATLLRELFHRSLEAMAGESHEAGRAGRVDTAKQALAARLADWPSPDIVTHLDRGTPAYWLGFDVGALERHARFIRSAGDGTQLARVETRPEPERGVTEVVVYAPDRAGLFAEIAGAISLSDASIVDAKITTLANGMALNSFSVQGAQGGAFESADRLAKLARRIEATLGGGLAIAREVAAVRRRWLAAPSRAFRITPVVLIDNGASAESTVIEVQGRDRPGFLHDVTAALTALGLHISSAHISTYGGHVVDVFYVRDVFGLKIESPDRLERVRERLLAAVDAATDTASAATVA